MTFDIITNGMTFSKYMIFINIHQFANYEGAEDSVNFNVSIRH
ncbi:hypothetical protein EMIT0210MI2_10209 [Priestia megaterium]